MFGELVKPGQIIIKDINVLRALMERQYSPLLIQIECALAKEHGVVITEAYRENDSGVHGHMRAFDNRSWCYPDAKAYQICDEINRKWQYDYKRPKKKCAMVHKVRNGEFHIHLQVHPNTRRISI